MGRYATPGKSEAHWVITIADPLAPTAAELNAGVDLTGFTRALPSVPRALNTVDIANLSSKYEARQGKSFGVYLRHPARATGHGHAGCGDVGLS